MNSRVLASPRFNAILKGTEQLQHILCSMGWCLVSDLILTFLATTIHDKFKLMYVPLYLSFLSEKNLVQSFFFLLIGFIKILC